MKAIVYEKYGPPSQVLQLKEVEKPTSRARSWLLRTTTSFQGDSISNSRCVYLVKDKMKQIHDQEKSRNACKKCTRAQERRDD
jgi:hypothetical protein